jgi:hypothetical protein
VAPLAPEKTLPDGEANLQMVDVHAGAPLIGNDRVSRALPSGRLRRPGCRSVQLMARPRKRLVRLGRVVGSGPSPHRPCIARAGVTTVRRDSPAPARWGKGCSPRRAVTCVPPSRQGARNHRSTGNHFAPPVSSITNGSRQLR